MKIIQLIKDQPFYRMKKILFILPSFNFGGTVFSTLNMIMMLRDKYDISVFSMTHDGPVKEQYKGINLLPEDKLMYIAFTRYARLKKVSDKCFALMLRFLSRILHILGIDLQDVLCRKTAKRLSKKYAFDIVASCQEDHSTNMASYFTSSKRIAWFRSEYSIFKNLVSENTARGHKALYDKFDNIVCVSKTTRDDFVSNFPSLDSKTLAIHNIQKTERIISMAKNEVDDLPDRSLFNIVSVGRFAKQKQFSFIPQIAASVKETGAKFRWIIIGDGNDAGEYDKTIAGISKYNVKDCIQCIGSRTNPYPYIANADLMVVPSYYEACPRVVIEAKILHTPVICADFSSAKEFVTNDVDGYVDEICKLGSYISSMILDDQKYNRINDRCKDYIFDNEGIKKQLYELFG